MGNLNRKTRRELGRYGIGEKWVKEEFEKQFVREKQFAYRNAWVSMMLALVDRFPDLRDADLLHSIAVDTLDYSNSFFTPAELEEMLMEKTGFDITERPEDSERLYIPKKEDNNGIQIGSGFTGDSAETDQRDDQRPDGGEEDQ